MYYLKLIVKAGLLALIVMLIILGMSTLLNSSVTRIASYWNIEINFKYFALIAVVFCIYKFRHRLNRYPFNVIFKARRIIHAPPSVVWKHIQPRARRKNYNVLISSIKPLGNDVYRHYYADGKDSHSNEPNYYDLKVLSQEQESFVEYEVLKEDNFPDVVQTATGYLITLKDLEDGRCEVRTFEVHKAPSLFTIYVYVFMGASRDLLRQLACASEERENISWASCEVARESLRNKPDATLSTSLKSIEEFLIMTSTAFVTMLIVLWAWVVF